MGNFLIGLGLGFIMGLTLSVILIETSIEYIRNIEIIDECEKELPRDQECILFAQPEVINNGPG